MIINYTPIECDGVGLKIDNQVIYFKRDNIVYRVDFSNENDGILLYPIDFIPFAKKENGVLEITIQQPVDSDGIVIESDVFDTNVCTNVYFTWKPQEEVEFEYFEKLLIPPKEEIDKANRELETINILIELEVI